MRLGTHTFENVHFYDIINSWYKSTLSIKIPHDCILESIPDYAFNDFDGVVLLENAASYNQIGEFCGCGNAFTNISDFSPKLTVIPSGMNPAVNALPDTVTEIASKAFTKAVEDFKLPSSIKKIALDAFPRYSSFVVEAGSYAELWCSENGFGYSIEGQEDDLSWLNN